MWIAEQLRQWPWAGKLTPEFGKWKNSSIFKLHSQKGQENLRLVFELENFESYHWHPAILASKLYRSIALQVSSVHGAQPTHSTVRVAEASEFKKLNCMSRVTEV